LPSFASSDIDRAWPGVYGVNVDMMEVRSSIGGASFIVTRRGARSYELGDDLFREDMGFLVGDNSKNLARFACRLVSSLVIFDCASALLIVLLFPPNLDNDTICSLTTSTSLSTTLFLFSSIHLSLCIVTNVCGSVSVCLSDMAPRNFAARSWASFARALRMAVTCSRARI
jgi:hypothetical protein